MLLSVGARDCDWWRPKLSIIIYILLLLYCGKGASNYCTMRIIFSSSRGTHYKSFAMHEYA